MDIYNRATASTWSQGMGHKYTHVLVLVHNLKHCAALPPTSKGGMAIAISAGPSTLPLLKMLLVKNALVAHESHQHLVWIMLLWSAYTCYNLCAPPTSGLGVAVMSVTCQQSAALCLTLEFHSFQEGT